MLLKELNRHGHDRDFPAFYPTSKHSKEHWMFSPSSVCLSVCLLAR